MVPQYLVPSHTTAIKATVSSSAPLFFDITYPYGDPDLISTTGKTATDSYSAPDVGAGDWTVTPFLVGPTGKNPAENVTANVSMTATTAGFDPAVSSPTGDLWLGSINAAATFTPYVVNPGQSVTIPVTITPSGAAGSHGKRNALRRRLLVHFPGSELRRRARDSPRRAATWPPSRIATRSAKRASSAARGRPGRGPGRPRVRFRGRNRLAAKIRGTGGLRVASVRSNEKPFCSLPSELVTRDSQ